MMRTFPVLTISLTPKGLNKDYLVRILCGRPCTDAATAVSSLLYDARYW